MKSISIVVPVYNEEENIADFHQEIVDICKKNQFDFEIIFVDDGSTDSTVKEIKKITPVKLIRLRKNFGQTAAMDAGIKLAKNHYVITMDGDGQNDPNDIPKMIQLLEEKDLDVVSGWRRKRKDGFLKRFVSRIANLLRAIIIHDGINDSGCSLKVYKKECFEQISLYGEMHRFIPAYASWRGGKVAEIIVHHRPRIHGKTNYGISRTFKVLLDLVVVQFLSKYMNKPIHFFGGFGFISLGFGFVFALASIILKIAHVRDFVATPLPVFAALFIIVGLQMVAMGIIAEILMRVYYESRDTNPYKIRETINL